MFFAYPTYPRYRTLQFTSPMQMGEDVFALQTALSECGFDCGEHDGVLGGKTSVAIKIAQESFELVVDGKAGGNTQKALALDICRSVATAMQVPYDAFRGQLEFESAYRLGNYSPMRPDGNYDAGIAQRNTAFTSAAKGFNAQDSIEALGTLIRAHYNLFTGVTLPRRWALAQGAWNAPAFACYLAREEGASKVTSSMTARPSTENRRIFEAYVTNASVYLQR